MSDFNCPDVNISNKERRIINEILQRVKFYNKIQNCYDKYYIAIQYNEKFDITKCINSSRKK